MNLLLTRKQRIMKAVEWFGLRLFGALALWGLYKFAAFAISATLWPVSTTELIAAGFIVDLSNRMLSDDYRHKY